MVKIFSFFLFFIISLKLYAIDTKAEQAVVIDFDTNEVLFEKNSNAKVIPASMTKIMILVIDAGITFALEFFSKRTSFVSKSMTTACSAFVSMA